MTTYNSAYCISLKKEISALEANRYYHNNIIFSNKDFQCCKNCVLPITCANLTVDYSDYHNRLTKKQPYFVVGDRSAEHSPTCSRIILQTSKKTKSKNEYRIEFAVNKYNVNYDKEKGLLFANESPSIRTSLHNKPQKQNNISPNDNNSISLYPIKY